MLHIIDWKLSAEKVAFVISAINFRDSSSGGTTTIGLIIYYVIPALCKLCLRSSLKQRITSAQYNEIVKVPSWLYAHSMIIDNLIVIGCSDDFFSNDPWPVGGSWGDNEVYTNSSKGSNHCCCSTNKASYWMKCRSYTHIVSVKCLVVLTFEPDIVLVGLLEISCRIPSMTFTIMNQTKVSFYRRSYDMNLSK